MSNIPAAMVAVAKAIDLSTEPDVRAVLEEALELMPRERAIRKAPPTSRRVTRTLAQAIRNYAAANPTASLQKIANVFGTNHGRVSEALNGKR